jgi:hypothetical protein
MCKKDHRDQTLHQEDLSTVTSYQKKLMNALPWRTRQFLGIIRSINWVTKRNISACAEKRRKWNRKLDEMCRYAEQMGRSTSAYVQLYSVTSGKWIHISGNLVEISFLQSLLENTGILYKVQLLYFRSVLISIFRLWTYRSSTDYSSYSEDMCHSSALWDLGF